MNYGYFVTGTDTGVGKTLVSAALVHAFAQAGWKAAGMKPVAAGCRREGDRLVSEDVELLCAAANVPLAPEIVNPYAFEPPLAPHIAAQQAGREIEMARIRDAFRQAATLAEVLVVEGVGGFRVPLKKSEDTADMALMLGLPVILVVGMRLGCLNHAMLTAEAVAARGLVLAGWVANGVDPQMAAFEQNLATLQAELAVPCLGVVPYLAAADFCRAATFINSGKLLQNDLRQAKNG